MGQRSAVRPLSSGGSPDHSVLLGIEDILLSETYNDRDYNDYVVSFETASVPEPGTLLLLSTGMAALALRKKRSARKTRVEATL